jgi:plastocyanin
MTISGRMRVAVIALVGAGLTLGLASLARASGGGGCGRPVTDAHGTRVTVKQFCFTPTVLHVRRGDAVTFANLDPFTHDLLGANAVWGSWDALRFGRPVTYRFVRAGVYPYVCTYHPGMVGAIVVGNGDGPGAARTTTTEKGPVIQVEQAPAHLVGASIGGGSSGSWPVAPILAFVLLALVETTLVAHLRRSRR